MKKSTLLLLSACLLVSSFSMSQDVNIYWGKENPYDRSGSISILGKRGNILWGYKQSRKKLSMVKYSLKDLQIQNEYPVIGDDAISNDYSFNDIFMMRNKTYIALTKYDRKADLNSVFMQEIDEAGKRTGKLKKLADISAKSKSNSGSFSFITSEDSSKILLVNNPPFDKYAGEKFGYKVFDENLKELNHVEITLPYKDKNFSAKDYILSNDGIIYLLAKIDLEKGDKKKNEAGYYYEIIAINPVGKGDMKEYTVKIPGKYIMDISYRLDEEKGIICSGFYGTPSKGLFSTDEINGIFFLRINKETKEIEAKGIKALDKDFVAELTSQRKADKGKGISNSFVLKHFVRRQDGGALLISEYSYDYVVVTTTTDPKTGMRSTSKTYHYLRNNIIVININPDGSIKWYANIPKLQHTTDDGGMYSSFMFSVHNDRAYFVFNDNPKNLDPTKVKTAKDTRDVGNIQKSTAVLVELTESGEFTKKALFSNKENKMTLIPKTAMHVSENEQIVSASNPGVYCCFIPFVAGKYKLVRFEFK